MIEPLYERSDHYSFFSISANSTSFGQKWERSPTGNLAMRISAAIMTTVLYHPSNATTKNIAPPAYFKQSQSCSLL